MTEKVAHTEEMEELIISYLLHNKQAREASSAVLGTKHFSSEVHKVFIKLMQESQAVTPKLFKEELYKYLHSQKLTDAELRQYLSSFQKIVNPPKTEEVKYVEENLNAFVKSQNVKIAFLKSGDLYKSGDLEAIVRLLEEAVNSGFQVQDLGLDYLNGIEERLAERRARKATQAIGIGVQEIDTCMSGGLMKGQVGLIIGGSGRGKSISLQAIARYNLVFNQGVIYDTLELSKWLIGDRLDVAEARIPLFELKAFEEDVRKSVEDLKNSTKGNLIIQEFVPKKTTVADLQAHIRLVKSKGVEVDTLIIDYLDLLGSSRRYDDPYHETEHIMIELVALAKEENIRIWTASQLNRAGMVAENPDESGIAGAINKFFNVDFAMFLAQTKDERIAKMMRLCVAKNRNGPAGGSVTIDTDYAFFTFLHKYQSEGEQDYVDVEA